MKYLDQANTLWAHENRSGNLRDAFYKRWIADGKPVEPADPPPPPPTADQKIDRAGEIFLAFLKAYAQREGLTLAQVRDAIKANL